MVVAVPLNLAVSLVTLTFALVVRSRAVSVAVLVPYLNEVAGLAVGGVASVFYGARFVSAIKSEHLIKTIAALLAALGVLILFEVAYPFQYAQVIPAGAAFHFGTGFALGILIGLVSSVLGVAGGELLIPTMMFIFGADIKTAGTASINRRSGRSPCALRRPVCQAASDEMSVVKLDMAPLSLPLWGDDMAPLSLPLR
jgi:uncharacterized protein